MSLVSWFDGLIGYSIRIRVFGVNKPRLPRKLTSTEPQRWVPISGQIDSWQFWAHEFLSTCCYRYGSLPDCHCQWQVWCPWFALVVYHDVGGCVPLRRVFKLVKKGTIWRLRVFLMGKENFKFSKSTWFLYQTSRLLKLLFLHSTSKYAFGLVIGGTFTILG